jgi:hypothetical protein
VAVKSVTRSTVKSNQKSNSANAGYSFQDFELIESIFVSANTASVTFSNLNQYAAEYEHLQIRWTARSSYTSFNRSDLAMRLNDDSGTNYSYHAMTSTGSGSPTSGGGASVNFMYFASYSSNSDASGSYGAGVIDLLDAFSSVKNKTLRGFAGRSGSSPFAIGVYGSLWRNTAPTNSITLYDLGGFSFISGSRFSLYGIR